MTQISKVVKEIEKEELKLTAKLEGLNNETGSNLKTANKHTYDVLKKSKFLAKDSKYDSVPTTVNYESIKQKQKVKYTELEKQKEKLDLQNCTFKPEINEKPKNTLAGYVPVVDRPLPRKEKHVEKLPTPEEVKVETSVEKKEPKKINENFYKQKLEWKSTIEETMLKIRLEKEEKAKVIPPGIPVTNKLKNTTLLKNDADFFTRLSTHNVKSKALKEKLEEKIYDKKIYSFAPVIAKPLNDTHSAKVEDDFFARLKTSDEKAKSNKEKLDQEVYGPHIYTFHPFGGVKSSGK